MFTTVFDSFGYCRIGSEVAALKPISRISRLTTSDSTGRLMKISVKAIAGAPWSILVAAPSGSAKNGSVTRRRGRYRRQRIGRDGDRRTGLQLELPDRHH